MAMAMGNSFAQNLPATTTFETLEYTDTASEKLQPNTQSTATTSPIFSSVLPLALPPDPTNDAVQSSNSPHKDEVDSLGNLMYFTTNKSN